MRYRTCGAFLLFFPLFALFVEEYFSLERTILVTIKIILALIVLFCFNCGLNSPLAVSKETSVDSDVKTVKISMDSTTDTNFFYIHISGISSTASDSLVLYYSSTAESSMHFLDPESLGSFYEQTGFLYSRNMLYITKDSTYRIPAPLEFNYSYLIGIVNDTEQVNYGSFFIRNNMFDRNNTYSKLINWSKEIIIDHKIFPYLYKHVYQCDYPTTMVSYWRTQYPSIHTIDDNDLTIYGFLKDPSYYDSLKIPGYELSIYIDAIDPKDRKYRVRNIDWDSFITLIGNRYMHTVELAL